MGQSSDISYIVACCHGETQDQFETILCISQFLPLNLSSLSISHLFWLTACLPGISLSLLWVPVGMLGGLHWTPLPYRPATTFSIQLLNTHPFFCPTQDRVPWPWSDGEWHCFQLTENGSHGYSLEPNCWEGESLLLPSMRLPLGPYDILPSALQGAWRHCDIVSQTLCRPKPWLLGASWSRAWGKFDMRPTFWYWCAFVPIRIIVIYMVPFVDKTSLSITLVHSSHGNIFLPSAPFMLAKGFAHDCGWNSCAHIMLLPRFCREMSVLLIPWT